MFAQNQNSLHKLQSFLKNVYIIIKINTWKTSSIKKIDLPLK